MHRTTSRDRTAETQDQLGETPIAYDSIGGSAYRLAYVGSYSYTWALGVHAAFCVLFFALGLPLLGFVNIASCLLYWIAIRLNRASRLHAAALLVMIEILAHAAVVSWYIGWFSGFPVYTLALLALLPLLPDISDAIRAAGGILFAAVFIALLILDRRFGPVHELNPTLLHAMLVGNAVVGFTLAGLVVHFIARAAEYSQQRVEQLARTDFLTGLHNRRSMLEKIEACVAEYQRTETPFSVIIGDLDGFKRINDRFGHETGDRVLCAVADAVGKCLRSTDTLGRWGGEEFLILLPSSRQVNARQVAERVLETTRDVRIDGYRRKGPSTTISLGVATYRSGEEISRLISRADQAMYLAKSAGKDRIRESDDGESDEGE